MSSVKDYPTLTKVFLKKLGINKKCHPEMIVSNKLNDKYIVMCSYCMRREYIKKHLRYKMKNNNDTPILKESHDHIYPRCVWCNGEIHGPAVIDYSKGLQECGAVNGCGKKVPEDWRLKDE